MDWKDMTLDQLKENRPDLLQEHTVAGLEVLAVANTGMQTQITALKAREMPPDLTAENATLKAAVVAGQQQLADALHDVRIEQVAHTLVGTAVAAKLRAENVAPEDLEEKAKAFRDEAIQASVASFASGQYAPKGKTFPNDADNGRQIQGLAITGVNSQNTAEMNEFQALMHNTPR